MFEPAPVRPEKFRFALRAPFSREPRVAVLGGGTGLSTLLSGLKHHTSRMTAVVTVTDEGGSSGRLRRAWGVVPPGDLRNCLAALADDHSLLSRLLQYRFPQALSPHTDGRSNRELRDSLAGHSFGNILLTALSAVAGGMDRAIAATSQVLAIRGRVLPVSLEHVRLGARLANGRRVVGELRISRSRTRIQKVRLMPSSPGPAPGVLDALAQADVVVLGPGSLYTSVIPPLLVRGVVETLARTRALKVYVCNVMTQPGETDGYAAEDHLEALLDHGHAPEEGRIVDVMLVNDRPFPGAVLRRYAKYGSFPVPAPRKSFLGGVRIVRSSLRPSFSAKPAPGPAQAQARHSPVLLAKAVMDLWNARSS